MRRRSQASVHHDGLARHVAVRIADEKRGEARDLIESAEAPERAVLEIVGETVVRQIAADAIFEQTRREAVDAYPIAGDLLRHRFGESLERSLARAVVNRRFDHPHADER